MGKYFFKISFIFMFRERERKKKSMWERSINQLLLPHTPTRELNPQPKHTPWRTSNLSVCGPMPNSLSRVGQSYRKVLTGLHNCSHFVSGTLCCALPGEVGLQWVHVSFWILPRGLVLLLPLKGKDHRSSPSSPEWADSPAPVVDLCQHHPCVLTTESWLKGRLWGVVAPVQFSQSPCLTGSQWASFLSRLR